ncbi:hypothetical protein [Allokutzneria sp. NRRL B-24872]|uniref:hypothetical protein n=1 Tax=Allokutzneria sp. NRRL B-24872 TaxID=1137961 RepID=UPI001177B1B5|nr:hypothetical protein [Allokutzneria sp. NRRL B-24872]
MELTVIDLAVISCLKTVPRGTWGMLGLYESLRGRAAHEEIDTALVKLEQASMITRDQLGIWTLVAHRRNKLIPRPRPHKPSKQTAAANAGQLGQPSRPPNPTPRSR